MSLMPESDRRLRFVDQAQVFVAGMNSVRFGHTPLSALAYQHLIDTPLSPLTDLALSIHDGTKSALDRGSTSVGSDSQIGFRLTRDLKSLEHVVVGVDRLGNEPKDKEVWIRSGLDLIGLGEDDFIIDSLQGNKLDRPVFPEYNWSQLLVALVVQWAVETGRSRVFLLPAKYHRRFLLGHTDVHEKINIDKRREAMLRLYDGTAEAMGFERMRKKGPYILNFT